MITRIVKMEFEPCRIDDFLSVFEASKLKIRNFKGCHHLELWQDNSSPNVIFTYSHWENEASLDNYRNSELFQNTWEKTKVLFNAKPQAWTVIKRWPS
ncbi:MAG TPA: antibiotic biosynthesis monooxygenase [Saprospiraceae bacterium]|nr:antibiotic biosynthesis monooxygenase [Saprospiraceae bacterium]HPQ22040.1 antibiotic biosynthesis monooxygenase [Saprospiraceae bacterium]